MQAFRQRLKAGIALRIFQGNSVIYPGSSQEARPKLTRLKHHAACSNNSLGACGTPSKSGLKSLNIGLLHDSSEQGGSWLMKSETWP